MKEGEFFCPSQLNPNFGARTILSIEPNSELKGELFWIKETNFGVKMEEEGVTEENHGKEGRTRGRGEDQGKEGRTMGRRDSRSSLEDGPCFESLYCVLSFFQLLNHVQLFVTL